MGILRDLLKTGSPELFNSLENSWDIAFDTWLPSVNTNKDTFNSYPHLRNLEVYADKATTAFYSFHHRKREFLSSLETYVLLASILFHDIGKTLGSSEHGIESERIVKNNWGLLGIPNEELANTLSRLCRFHDEKGHYNISCQITNLSTSVVDPYGAIREREIGALLMLVDHIDGSVVRVVPDFIREDSTKGIIGAFRKKIRGIDIDLDGAMVKVVLGEDGWEDGWNTIPDLNNQFEVKIDFKKLPWKYYKKYFKSIQFTNRKSGAIIDSIKLDNNKIDEDTPDIYKKINSSLPLKNQIKKLSNLFTLTDSFIIHKYFIIDRIKYHKNDLIPGLKINSLENDYKKTVETWIKSSKNITSNESPFPPRKLLAVLLGNTEENVAETSPLRNILSSFGLPIRGWVLEFKNHLFDANGHETFEPIFTKEYLKHATECMWYLSTQIFAHGSLKYEMLASEMREPNITKVKRAVRRLSILSSKASVTVKNDKCTLPEAIWYSETHWKWNIKPQTSRQPCDGTFLHSSCLLSVIDSLKCGVPHE